MNKQTKRIRRNRIKNKSRKHYGGSLGLAHKPELANKPELAHKNNGIFNIISDKLSVYSDKALNYVKDKGLRLAGLQVIKEPETNTSAQEVDQKLNELSNSPPGVITSVKNVFDKGSAAIITNINEVLGSQKISESIGDAAKDTAIIGEQLLGNFNKVVSTPEMKEQTRAALENTADYANIVIESMNEPVNKAMDSLNEAGTKAASGAVTGAIKVGSNAMAAVPGFGALISLGKIANDVTAAVGDVVESASNATTTISKIVEETSENIAEGFDKLEEKKKSKNEFNELNKNGLNVTNRVNKSINEFENPVKTVPSVLKGGRKTRRPLLKHKRKTKNVRFVI
jgi:hypothetical protein